MKNILIYILILATGKPAFAQDSIPKENSTSNPSIRLYPLKSNDQVLSKWAIDVNYKRGFLSNNVTMKDYSNSYESILRDSNISNPNLLKGGNMQSVGLQLCYFFGKNSGYENGWKKSNRQFGISSGVTWIRLKGTFEMEHFYLQYKSNNIAQGNATFRQILTNIGTIKEEVTTNNFVIPILLKYKHQFKGSKLGVAFDAGALVGFSNSNRSNSTAKFTYEAIYAYGTNNNTYYDTILGNSGHGNNSQILTSEYLTNNPPSEVKNGDVQSYFDLLRNDQGYNVAIGKDIGKKNEKSNFTSKISYGFTIQPSVTYYLSYNTTFMLGAYYSYQVYQNKSEQYRLTSTVGDYSSMINGMKKNVVTSWGLNVGLRFFFGEHRDIDGDGTFDRNEDPHCIELYGLKNFHGCPDYDGDNTMDSEDSCKYDPGPEITHGCPDRDEDGFADKIDECPDDPGNIFGCPLELYNKKHGVLVRKASDDDAVNKTEKEKVSEDYDILQSHVINFEFGKSEILSSNFKTLDDAANLLNQQPEMLIIVSGHTDSIGTYTSNMKLSFERANAVSVYLQSKGISKERILADGYGKERPITSNNVTESRALNRRTEMMLVKPIKPKK